MPNDEVPVEAWLDENGICHFPSSIQNKPAGIYIDGFTNILQLVVGIEWNKPGPGYGIYDWSGNPDEITGEIPKIPSNVLNSAMGVQLDVAVIDRIQEMNAGRGILLGEADGDIQDMGLTPEEWMAKYHTNGVAQIAKMRLDYFGKGAGVHVPYRPATPLGVWANKPPHAGTVNVNLGNSGRPPVQLGDPRNR